MITISLVTASAGDMVSNELDSHHARWIAGGLGPASRLVPALTEKSRPTFWGNPTQKPRVKKIKINLEHILRPIQNLVSSLPGHFGIGVMSKRVSK